MTRSELIEQIRSKSTMLCVGLDTDIEKIPKFLLQYQDPVFEFNKRIIDATKDYCVAYKPNLAFYESLGSKGYQSLEKTMDYIPDSHFTIADAKRGDIGNTSRLYAKTFFEHFNFDAITLSPYMGADSVLPYLEFEDKWVIVLGLTSNKGREDVQLLPTKDDQYVYEEVMQRCALWTNSNNCMFVVGASDTKRLKNIRQKYPDHFFLVPGIGAQGGSLENVLNNGSNPEGGMLINSSRGILYKSQDRDFDYAAAQEAKLLSNIMASNIK